MATCCDACGHRDNEVKSGGGIEPKGRRITLVIEKSEDMTRDVLKVQINSVVFLALPLRSQLFVGTE